VVPQQALAMTNSRLVLDCAKPIAAQISKAIPKSKANVDDTEFIRDSFTLLLASTPTDTEQDDCTDALKQWRALPNISADDSRSYLVWSLLNHNDFITLR
jgi:hypothetical protein